MTTETQLPSEENKMGVMPIRKLLITMSLPMMISMLVQALYNIVDSIFVAQIDANALSAVSLAFPLQTLMISVATGTGVGINSLLSRNLGEKKFKEANIVANNGMTLGILSFAVFALIGIFFSRTFFELQTAGQTDPLQRQTIVDYGTSYLSICLICSFGIFLEITGERLLQSTGRTLYNMISQTCGAVINIIMDPLLIFGIGPFPKMGIAGAATATVFGQICAMLIALYFNMAKNDDIQLKLSCMKPDTSTIKNIYAVGVPSILMQSIGSVLTLGMNNILMGFSTIAVNVYGIYFKLQSFIFMPVFGLNNGIVPIVAYNYGARKPDRIMKTLKAGVLIALSIMAAGTLIFMVFPTQLLSLFNADSQLLELGVPALRIISTHFMVASASIILITSFQALGNGVYSLIVSIIRQLVVILPAAYILSRAFGVHAIWWAFPIAELVSVSMALLLFRKIYREKVKPLY